jgi:hypothetical protein
MRRLRDAALPDEVELTTIGAATDLIVPGTAATRPGTAHTTVLPRALDAHTGIVTDPGALSSVRAALERQPLPCRSLVTTVAGEVLPTVITGVERDLGRTGTGLGRIADRLP